MRPAAERRSGQSEDGDVVPEVDAVVIVVRVDRNFRDGDDVRVSLVVRVDVLLVRSHAEGVGRGSHNAVRGGENGPIGHEGPSAEADLGGGSVQADLERDLGRGKDEPSHHEGPHSTNVVRGNHIYKMLISKKKCV